MARLELLGGGGGACLANPMNTVCLLSSCLHLEFFLKLLVLILMPSFPPLGVTFVLTSHIFRTFLARSRYFSTFSSPFFSHLSILWNYLDCNFTALVFLVNCQKIRSSGPNLMVCSNTEAPQKFEVVIFKHVLQDMVIPPFISLKPTLSCQMPMDCPTHCVIVSDMHLQYD